MKLNVDGKLNVHILVTTNRKQMDITYYKNHPYAEKREDGMAQWVAFHQLILIVG